MEENNEIKNNKYKKEIKNESNKKIDIKNKQKKINKKENEKQIKDNVEYHSNPEVLIDNMLIKL